MFEQHNITAESQVAPAVLAFAATAGWTVSGNHITRPGGGKTFAITYAAGVFRVEDVADPTVFTTCATPKIKGVLTGFPTNIQQPEEQAVTSLHLFGGTSPEPYLAVVMECGFNLFRHVYVGNMVKLGDYTGGEVIGCTMQTPMVPLSMGDYFDIADVLRTTYLFGGRRTDTAVPGSQYQLADDAGGVNVVHADNPVPWRRFRSLRGFGGGGFAEDVALGGMRDEINDGLVYRGKATYAGSVILVPINLYATRYASPNNRFIPLGHPAGVRMVNVEALDPATDITIANKLWRVFPQLSKQGTRAVARFPGGYAVGESSEFFGLAYPKD
jgi:hypothetical protein